MGSHFDGDIHWMRDACRFRVGDSVGLWHARPDVTELGATDDHV